MATGYTHPVADGEITDIKDFAATCARAFGAFVHQRDGSLKDELRYPDHPDGGFYYTSLREARVRLTDWLLSTEEDKYREWSEYYNANRAHLHKSRADNAVKRARYESMISQLEEISVPSELQNYRDFMMEQLTDSLKHDCGNLEFTERYYRPQEFVEWVEHEDERVRKDVRRYTEEYNKEVERYEDRVKFINLMADTFGFHVRGRNRA